MLGDARRRHVLQDRVPAGLVSAGAALILALAGCGSEGDDSGALAVAEARVSAKEKDLAEAKSDLADKSAQFCQASQTYIRALDRYGDVLSETTTTVGDVEDAGSELEQPREDTMDGAEEAVAAQQVVVDAKAELAEAEAAMRDYTMTLQQSLLDAGYYDDEVDGVYGPATVDAVEALQRAHGLPVTGTVDNASAAALERDLAAKGGATEQEAAASTAAVQQTLKLAGFWDGPVDGEWTEALTGALKDFQTELGVEPTGAVDAATIAAVERAIAETEQEASAPPTNASPTASPAPRQSPTSPPTPSRSSP